MGWTLQLEKPTVDILVSLDTNGEGDSLQYPKCIFQFMESITGGGGVFSYCHLRWSTAVGEDQILLMAIP